MQVGNWLKSHIRTASDFTPASAESDAIQKDLDQLADRVDELKQPVEVSLEGGYDDLSAPRKLALGAAGGAAVGGVLGAAQGFLSPIGDSVEARVNWTTTPIMEQSLSVTTDRNQLSGLASQVTADGVIDVSVKGGVRYDFDAEILENQVGEFKTPEGVTLERTSSGNVMTSGLIGLGVGAGVGLAATGALIALKSFRKGDGQEQSEPPRETAVVTPSELKTMAGFGTLGAVGGAGVGALSGWMEQNRAAGLSQEVTWETPVMETRDIGTVPEPASILIRQDVDFGDSLKGSQIYRDPSKFDLDDHIKNSEGRTVQGTAPAKTWTGAIKMEEHSETYTAEAKTTAMASALGGALVGGLVGVAAGVCYNTLKRMIEA